MDAIVILGAAVWADGPSPTLRRRAERGAQLWHDGAANLIVACGGLGRHPPTEAAAIASVLYDCGVPEDVVLRENRSTTTLDNIRLARPLLYLNGVTRLIIVTDATHAPRAALVARHFGFKVLLRPTSLRGSHHRTVARQAIRELGALPLYAIRLFVTPKS